MCSEKVIFIGVSFLSLKDEFDLQSDVERVQQLSTFARKLPVYKSLRRVGGMYLQIQEFCLYYAIRRPKNSA